MDKPNIVIIYTDDQGYGDLGCFGATGFSTPRIDRMAREGVRLTSFYAAPVCTPSRASLMTGCYPIRVGLEAGTGFGVLFTGDPKGLDPREISMPRMFKEVSYATGMFGKWHLGDQPDFLPTRHGFDEFWGTPYSNDMWNKHPKNNKFHFPPLPLLEGEKVAEIDPDQFHLTRRTADRAVDFISRNRDRPFFLCSVQHAASACPRVGAFPEQIRDLEAEGWGDGRALSDTRCHGRDVSSVHGRDRFLSRPDPGHHRFEWYR